MKKIITTSISNVVSLYSILKNCKLESVENRKRWKFLNVFKKQVVDYEDALYAYNKEIKNLTNEWYKKIDEIQDKSERQFKQTQMKNDIQLKVDEINKIVLDKENDSVTLTFTDVEIFNAARAIFSTAGKDLEGQLGEKYYEIESAFMEVKDVDD